MNEKRKNKEHIISVWFKELRAPFFTAAIIPVFAGMFLAWAYYGVFLPLQFTLTIIGAILLHAGTNVINDYFDYRSGNDIVNIKKNPPYSGGSPYLPNGRLSQSSVYRMAILLFALGSFIGLYLAFDMGLGKGWVVIMLGIIGVIAGYFYVEPHVNLCGKGLGELFIGLCFGPLIVFGAFYVQTRTYSALPIIMGIPIGLLIAAVVYINQFPDYGADKSVGKRNIVVRLGRKRAVKGYLILIILVYISIVLAVLPGLFMQCMRPYSLTPLALIVLLTVPIAAKSIRTLMNCYNESQKLVPAQALMIQVHLFTGILLCTAVYVSRITGIF